MCLPTVNNSDYAAGMLLFAKLCRPLVNYVLSSAFYHVCMPKINFTLLFCKQSGRLQADICT